MNFLKLLKIEFMKTKRSKPLPLIFMAALVEDFLRSFILSLQWSVILVPSQGNEAADMEAILTTNQISKFFGRQKANDAISITVPKNSIYGLLGPNGAGKSTLLKTITGMITPSSGEIFFQGAPWNRKDLAKIGALIEEPPIYENLTAFENLKVRALLYRLPDERIREVLELVGLSHTGRKKAGQFSMGMKQRLGIALALLNHPSLLILDEPTNGLDPIGIQDLRDLIRSFPRQGVTVILSSHILTEVQQTADEIGIIAHGRLWYEGPIRKEEDLEALFLDVVKKSEEAYV